MERGSQGDGGGAEEGSAGFDEGLGSGQGSQVGFNILIRKYPDNPALC